MRPILVCLVVLAAACTPEAGPTGFRAGFGRADITPAIPEPWTDVDANGRFSAAAGDTFEDRNANGVFDALWLAGSFEGRAAASIADSLTATALVVDDGERRIALVAIDNFGMMLDDVEDVRSRIPPEWEVDRTLIFSSGTHSAPDLVGWWTPEDAALDARGTYLETAKDGIVSAVGRAVEALEPARMQLAEFDDSEVSPVVDLRPPYVYDPGIRLMRFVDAEDATIGTVISWTCTPELMGNANTAVSPDFVGALRSGLEDGLGDDRPGLGGMSLFLNGAYGGRLTVPEDAAVLDRLSSIMISEPGVAKTGAVARVVAGVILDSLRQDNATVEAVNAVQVFRTGLRVAAENLGAFVRIQSGRMERHVSPDSLLSTEMHMVLVGNAWILALPGESFPELSNGGIEAQPGSDFAGRPESPTHRLLMLGSVNVVTGNAGDALGPIIPYVEWDADPVAESSWATARFEEERSPGPFTANVLTRGFIGLMRSSAAFMQRTATMEEANGEGLD